MKIKFLSVLIVLFCAIDLLPQKMGDAYPLNINNIYMPINRRGVLADANISPLGSGGQFGGHAFLFSGGFFLSGYSNGQLWANAVASASLVEDYLPGTNVGGQYDPNAVLYKLSSFDEPFVSQSWQDWADAVTLGADFYDGNNDGIYNPVDYNSNGQWDGNEDRPDLLGDESLWCVYHDGRPSSQRRWNTIEPQGIEIRQTVFAYSNIPALSNIIFIRYRIINTGIVAYKMTEVYFGIWDDPDLGTAGDDLVGCDTLLQSGFTYNDGADPLYGNNPPAFFQSFLVGPRVYIPGETFVDYNGNGIYDEGIDYPLDTAFVHCGQELGVTFYSGAKNQTLSSSIEYRNGDPTLNDPSAAFEARNYMLGLDRIGNVIDPCTFPYGDVRGGVNCADVNPFFWLSGDPVNDVGWINNSPTDQRQMQNIGPFELEAGEAYDILVSYNIGQGSDAINSITEGRIISNISRLLYDCNFDTNCVNPNDVEVSELLPEEYFLHQNYPNPFNPSTTISYSIPEAGNVELKVYDILGNEVATLVNRTKTPGNYTAVLNASSFASGVYVYTLRTNDFVQTRKMMLLK